MGDWLIPRLPMNRQVFTLVRLELNAFWVRVLHCIHPGYRSVIQQLSRQRNIRTNIGCGPFGLPRWVNLDLINHAEITLRSDCRHRIPLADGSCEGIHVEHFFEHLCPVDERPLFLRECWRCLEPGGILRIIVPDAELYIRAYISPGWDLLNSISCGGELPERAFSTKLEALNHVFLQGGEHYGAYDAETLSLVLTRAGFCDVARKSWREGDFPGGAIDREQHKPYSLYFEARR
jgi:predicted SAM-dependent methyltransferase